MSGFASSLDETYEKYMSKYIDGFQKYDKYSDKSAAIEAFTKQLAEEAVKIDRKDLLQVEGDSIDARVANIKTELQSDFHNTKAKIQALRDFLMLAMEDSPPKTKQLRDFIAKKANEVRISSVNSIRNYFGYANLPSEPSEASVPDIEMSDNDVIKAVVSLAFDPEDHSVFYAANITEDELDAEIKGILTMVDAQHAISVDIAIDKSVKDITNEINDAKKILFNVSKTYSDKLKDTDLSPIFNSIGEFIRNTTHTTRSKVADIMANIAKIKADLVVSIVDENTQKALDDIAVVEEKMKKDETGKWPEYRFARFKSDRMTKMTNILNEYIETQKGTTGYTDIMELQTKMTDAVNIITVKRAALKELLSEKNVMPKFTELEAKVAEEKEKVFITHIINKGNITKTLTAAFPPSVGNNGSDSDNGPHQKRSRANPNRNNSYGGKRKRTSKKHHKKGKKAKSIKRIKKTMKRKNGKKATRRRS